MAEEYLDEIILKERNRRQKEQAIQEILEEGLPEEVLQTVEIGEIAEIKLPAFFQDMPREIADRRYSFEPQPQIIKTNREGTVDFTFSVLEAEGYTGELQENVNTAKRGLQRFMPTTLFLEEGTEEVNGIKIYWFSYIKTAFSGAKSYNMFFCAAMNKIVMITMNCKADIKENCSAIARCCIRTLRGKESWKEQIGSEILEIT